MNERKKFDRNIRISDATIRMLEKLGTLGDTYDSLIRRLAEQAIWAEENRIPSVVDNADVTEVLELIRTQSFIQDTEREFLLHLVPMCLPSHSFEAVNCFKTILRGCMNLDSTDPASGPRLTVLELMADQGTFISHDYLVTPLNFQGSFSSMAIGLYSYVFIGCASSGYAGTGPKIQEQIQNELSKNKSVLRHVTHKVRSMESFTGLFYERGPVVDIYYPNFEISRGGFSWDRRFARKEDDNPGKRNGVS